MPSTLFEPFSLRCARLLVPDLALLPDLESQADAWRSARLDMNRFIWPTAFVLLMPLWIAPWIAPWIATWIAPWIMGEPQFSILAVGLLPVAWCVSVFVWRKRIRRALRSRFRRIGIRVCLHCGHPMMQLDSMRCPECGGAVPPLPICAPRDSTQ